VVLRYVDSNRMVTYWPHQYRFFSTYRYDQFLFPRFNFIFLDSTAGNKELSYGSGQIDYETQYRYLTI